MGRILNGVVCLSAFLGASVSASLDHPATSDRVLRAASRRSDLFRRNVRIGKKFGAELSFIESENGWGNDEIFASQLKVASKDPILNLEEIEHHLDQVKCEDGIMKLSFVDAVSARDARHACSGGLIITSHESCNPEGERSVYRVDNLNFPEDDFSLELSVIQKTWKDAFDRFDIDFGYTTDSHLFRRHADFAKVRRRRQEPSITVPPVAIPTDTSEDVQSAKFDLSSQLIDKTFDPKEFLSGIENVVAIPDLPVEVGCKNCTTTGNIVLTQGSINIDMSQVDLIPDVLEGGDDGKSLLNVVTGGFFQLSATDVSAHIEVFARPKVSGNFEIGLPSLPIVGFTIPNVGRAGVSFNASLLADYEVTGGVEVNYGFDIAVPNDSNIKVELTDLPGSGVVGFPNATLQPLPFSANVTDIDIKLGLAFRPTIPIGFEFLDQLEAGVSIFIDLPRLDAHLSTKQNADPNCNTLPGNNTATPPYSNSTSNNTAPNTDLTSNLPSFELPGLLGQLGPLVLVEANVSINVGVGAEFKFPLLPPPVNGFNTQENIFETTFTLGSTCLAAGKGYQTASDVWSSITSSYMTGAPPASATSPCYSSTATVYVYPGSTPVETGVPVESLPPPVLPPAPSQSFPVPGNTTVPVPGTGTGIGQQPPAPTSPSPSQFTGDATPAHVPTLSFRSFGWQSAIMGVSFVAGAMILL